jgi:hypothetical protein
LEKIQSQEKNHWLLVFVEKIYQSRPTSDRNTPKTFFEYVEEKLGKKPEFTSLSISY